MVRIERPGSSTDINYDDSSFLTSIIHIGNGTINSFTYTTDNIGNRTKIDSPLGTYDFTYDNNNQLLSSTSAEPPSPFDQETFTYSSMGNRTTDQSSAQVYDAQKIRLLEDTKNLYTYDNNGNTLSITEKSTTKVKNFTYSTENQLLNIKSYDDATLLNEHQFIYDSLGQRYNKKLADALDQWREQKSSH